jgi:hypothetical protein
MLTSKMDTHVNILLTLPYNDLENYCFSSKTNNLICHNNQRIQHRLGQVNEMVNDTVKLAKIDDARLLPTNMEMLKTYKLVMNKYNINFLYSFYHDLKHSTVIYISIFESRHTEFYIQYKIEFNWLDVNYTKFITTSATTEKQVKEFLFHLFYDNMVYKSDS